MNGDLFRREVLEARNEDWLGTVRLRAPALAVPMAVLAIVAVAGLLALLAFGSHTRKQRVSGRVVPSTGLPALLAPGNGAVASVAVREGQRVAAGARLLRLDLEPGTAAAGAGLSATIGRELARKRERLDEDLRNARAGTRQDEQALRGEIARLERQRSAAGRRTAALERQAAQARAMLEQVRPLGRERIVSAVQLQDYEAAALAAEAEHEAGRQEQLDIEQRLADSHARLRALPLQAATRRGEIERELADLGQEDARNVAAGVATVRAPRAGVVTALAVSPGDGVRAGQRLVSVVPVGAALQAELWVPSDAAGLLRRGTRVAIRYDAYPYQHHGLRFGRVVGVAGVPSSPAEIEDATGQRVPAPAYRVMVAPEPGQRPLALRPGMTLQADLLLERRRLAAWLFDPLRAAAGSAP